MIPPTNIKVDGIFHDNKMMINVEGVIEMLEAMKTQCDILIVCLQEHKEEMIAREKK